MRKDQIDADKIVKHIKYTKHWLDKANNDFQEKNFASGGAILNIARAELTTAWEEAMQLKTELFKTIPKKARNNWKPAASVGLLASGFIMAFMLTQFTQRQVPQTDSLDPVSKPAIILQQTAAETPAAAPAESIVSPAVQPEKPVARRASAKTAKSAEPASSSAQPAHEAVAPLTDNTQPEAAQPLPYSPIGHQPAEAQPITQEKQKKELGQSEVIELFKTAESSLRK